MPGKTVQEAIEKLKIVFDKGFAVDLANYKAMPKLNKPKDYHDKIQLLQSYYRKDNLFKSLVDSWIRHAIDGHDWEVISSKDERLTVEQLRSSFKDKKSDSEKEEDVWKLWDRELNLALNNVLPGTGRIDEWLLRRVLQTGMCALSWEYGKVDFEDGRFTSMEVPTIMVDWPSESVRLERSEKWNSPERTWIKKSTKKPNENRIDQGELPKTDLTTEDIDKSTHEFMPSIADRKQTATFVVKMNWSPGEVTVRDGDGATTLFEGLYPNPPFESLIPWLMMREALSTSDLQILDGLINVVLAWIIGNEKQDIKASRKEANGTVIEGDFEKVKKMLEEFGAQKIEEIFLPWWVELKFISPPAETLTNVEKYVQATMELLNAFGIFFSEKGAQTDFDLINFEQAINHIRNTILIPFWRMVTGEVVRRNKNLTTVPNRRYNPLPFSREAVITSIEAMHKSGEISTETMNRVLGIDPTIERARVRKEVGRQDRKVYDEAVPTVFKQDVVKGAGQTSKTSSVPPGRPKNAKDSKKRDLQ